MAQQCVTRAPQDTQYWQLLGVAQYRAGDCQAAIESLNTSMELRFGGNAVEWLFLAMAHWQLGQKEEASRWHGRAVKSIEKNRPPDLRCFPRADIHSFLAEANELLGSAPASTG